MTLSHQPHNMHTPNPDIQNLHVDPKDGTWYTPTLVYRQPDGSYLLKPGKPQQRGTTAQVSKATGIHRKVLHRLADVGFIRRARPCPKVCLFYYADVEQFLAKTEADPDFWEGAKKSAFLRGTTLRTAHEV